MANPPDDKKRGRKKTGAGAKKAAGKKKSTSTKKKTAKKGSASDRKAPRRKPPAGRGPAQRSGRARTLAANVVWSQVEFLDDDGLRIQVRDDPSRSGTLEEVVANIRTQNLSQGLVLLKAPSGEDLEALIRSLSQFIENREDEATLYVVTCCLYEGGG